MATRRGKHEGSIRKRTDGRWEARYVAADGVRKSLFAKTRQEAARALTAALQHREFGLDALNERQTVSTYLATWIESYKPRRRVSSYERYETEVRRYLIPAFTRIALTKLTPQQVEQFYARKLAAGMTPYSVWYCHRVLNHALNDALRLGLVHRNVVKLIRPPRVPKREMAFLTEEQAQTLLAAVHGDRLEAFVVLALATGMREGELLALRWEDIDLERASVLVRANLMRTRKTLMRDETKTGHSRRRIALPLLAVDALKRHRARQAEERLRLGERWRDPLLVFANHAGVSTMRATCASAGFIRSWSALASRAFGHMTCATQRPRSCSHAVCR
jgi:integrase